VSILKDHPTLKSLCGNKGNEVELDMSGKMGGAADAIMLVPEFIDNGALSVLNLAANNLGELVPPEGWSIKNKGYSFQKYLHVDGREQTEDPGCKPEGVIALANAIPDMRALSVLSLRNNNLEAVGCKALAEGLKDNHVITELSIADCNLSSGGSDMSGVIALASAIPDMGALSSLNLAKNALRTEGVKQLSGVIKVHKTLTILDISSNEIGAYKRDDDGRGPWIASPDGPITLAGAIEDNGALRCTDGTPYQSTNLFMLSTHVCSHCGQHKTQHTSRLVHTLSPHD
jgi:hypothetical protein